MGQVISRALKLLFFVPFNPAEIQTLSGCKQKVHQGCTLGLRSITCDGESRDFDASTRHE
jgi:hypothetical protein